MVEIQWHSQTKERATENTNFNLHQRASPRPYLREAPGEIPLAVLPAAPATVAMFMASEGKNGRNRNENS
jgi:hypothetical protein